MVAFTFTFLDPDAVRVTGFFPLSEYVSGRTKIDVEVDSLTHTLPSHTLSVCQTLSHTLSLPFLTLTMWQVKNLPAGLVHAQVILDFGASNATCESVDTTTGVLTFEIPTTVTAGTVNLRLHLLASGETLGLPRTFDYLEQKPAVITSVSPSKASIRTAGNLTPKP